MSNITEEQIEEKRRRNAEADAELRKLESERLERENGLARQQKADHLDAEYARIQAAIERAKALNAASGDSDAAAQAATEAAAVTEVSPIVVPTPVPTKSNGDKAEGDTEAGVAEPGKGK